MLLNVLTPILEGDPDKGGTLTYFRRFNEYTENYVSPDISEDNEEDEDITDIFIGIKS